MAYNTFLPSICRQQEEERRNAQRLEEWRERYFGDGHAARSRFARVNNLEPYSAEQRVKGEFGWRIDTVWAWRRRASTEMFPYPARTYSYVVRNCGKPRAISIRDGNP